MAKKSTGKWKNLIFELSSSGVFVFGLLYLGAYYFIEGGLPECAMNLNLSIPVTIFAITSLTGNLKSILNKVWKI